MKLELKAKHFSDADFMSDECSIGKAFKELTGFSVSVSFDWVRSDGKTWFFERYGKTKFNSDFDLAKSHNFDETVIRTIELTEL